MYDAADGNYPELRLLIGDEWRPGAPGAEVLNPSDETPLGLLPHASPADLADAVAAARAGFATWSRTDPDARADIMLRAAALLRERAEPIATVVALEQGKPIRQARAEVQRGSEFIEWDANEGRRLYGRIIPAGPGMRRYVTREPIGVVAGFTPWNFPVNGPCRKIGAALAAGCSIILKPSEETPASAILIAEAFRDAGLPPGVLNLVFGSPAEISTYLIDHPAVRLITFTGSVPVGKMLAAAAGARMKPVLMELGGHGPVIVADDVDPVAAGRLSAVAKARNGGQICVSPTRFFVERKSYRPFVDAFVEKATSLKIGPALDPETEIGPLANMRRLTAVSALLGDARDRGADVVLCGQRPAGPGFYHPLAVVDGADESLAAMTEEPFGPIALMVPVDGLDEALERANALPFGLAGYAFARAAENVERIARGLAVGNVAINDFTASTAATPFGGIRDSGIGREGGIEGLYAFTQVKTVSHRYDMG